MKPQVSKLAQSGKQPSSEMRSCVGRMPYRPQWLAGARTEPPVSLPSAKSARPVETADADPDDDPPVMRQGAAPFTGAPKCALLPRAENASSSVMVLPTKRAPASSSAETTAAWRVLMPERASMCGLPAPVG